MNISAHALRHPRLLLLGMVTAIVWGCMALATLPRQEDPALTWRLANVVTRMPGTSSERVETLITNVLEHYVQEVDDVAHIYSVSRAGVSLLQIQLSDDVQVAEPAWQKVRQQLNQAVRELPAGVLGPDLDDEIMGTFAQLFAITGATASDAQLRDHAQDLEDRLRYLPMTASTECFGVQPEVIQIELDPSKLAVYELTIDGVAQTIRSRNTRQPAGRLEIGPRELIVETSGEIQQESELRDMVLLATADGNTLRLHDVAEVRRTVRTPPEPVARVNGEQAVVVGVRARSDVRMDRFGEQTDKLVAEFRRSLPPGVQCIRFHDMPRYTHQRSIELSRTFLFSAASVFLSIFIFMGWRGASIVTAAIPLSGLMVVIAFSLLGIPLNQMSVMAIIMAFGLLVDNAIIVTEQIHQGVLGGGDPRRLAGEQPARLLVPLVISSLTTIAAFVPIYLLPGGTGEFVRSIPVGLAICLLTSLFIALTIVPWLCVQFIKPQRRAYVTTASPDARHKAGQGAAAQFYIRFLRGCVQRPRLILLAVVFVMLVVATTGLALRRDFFSPVQRDQFVIDVFLPQGSSLLHTSAIVAQVESQLRSEHDEIVCTASFIGRNAPLVFYNLQSQDTYANHTAQLVTTVRNWSETFRVANRVQQTLDASIIDAHCCVRLLEHGAPSFAPFEVRINGPSLVTLHQLGERAKGLLKVATGVRQVRSNMGNPAMKLAVEVNDPAARMYQIDQEAVARDLHHGFDGLNAGYLREGDERIDVVVRLPPWHRKAVADLTGIGFKPTAAMPRIPFSSIAAVRPGWDFASIYRRDSQRTVSILAYPAFGETAAQVARRFLPQLRQLQQTLPEGYTLTLGGENEQRETAENQLLANGIYAVFGILLLLTAEFGSFRLTGLILLTIPLAWAGAFCGLFLTGWPLNFMAIMGMMMLMGLVVNDAVILIDAFEQKRAAGHNLEALVIEAAHERSRHVIITTITTIAGFLPLALSPSLLWPPLAIAVIAGIAVSTVLTLVFIPVAYICVRRVRSGG